MTAERIASTWRPAAVRTSPLERCVVTGTRIAEACGLQSLSTQGLIDLHYGEWQWKTYDEVNEQSPHLYALWRSAPHLVRFPFGESLQDIVLRSADVFRSMIEGFPGDTVVLVGHDSVNRALLLQVLDQPLSANWKIVQDPCCLNVIEYDKGTTRVVAINDALHIKWSTASAAPRKLLKKRSTSRA
jgi:broad specificity phosphatase PhoE